MHLISDEGSVFVIGSASSSWKRTTEKSKDSTGMLRYCALLGDGLDLRFGRETKYFNTSN